MISPDTAAGVLVAALLSGIVGPGLMPYGFLMYRQRVAAMVVHKKPSERSTRVTDVMMSRASGGMTPRWTWRQECGWKSPAVRAVYPGDERPEPERCPGCGCERVIMLRVLYEGEG